MKIVLLCTNQTNQIALASKLANKFLLAGIVFENKPKQKLTIRILVRKVIDKIIFSSIASSWNNMLRFYKNYSIPSTIKSIHTSSINSKDTINFINEIQPDLIMVSGTSLIKKEILNIKIPKGIINLHTGLSPYVKGGPNCTNWCIANNTPEFIGNTIMWLNTGIDSGNIICSQTVNFNGNEDLNELHLKVMEHAHSLYLAAAKQIQDNFEKCPSIPQKTIHEGNLYLTKMWNLSAKCKFKKNSSKKNLKKLLKHSLQKQSTNTVKLVSLN